MRASTWTRFALGLAAIACAGCKPVVHDACETAIDCDPEQRCKDGRCQSLTGEGEGEGEGEGGVVGDTAAITAFCAAEITCQATGTDCQTQLSTGLQQLRTRNTPVCTQAADAEVAVFACAATQPCSVLLNSGELASVCPALNQAQNLVSQCGFVGEGEGEGIGEGEGEPVCAEAGVLPAETGNAPAQPFSVFAQYDATPVAACGTPASATLTISLSGDAALVNGGESSFTGFDAFALLNIVVTNAGTITATACADDTSRAEVAVELFGFQADGTNAISAIVCGQAVTDGAIP